MAFVATFEVDYGTSFGVARTTDIAQDFLLSNLICGASFASCMRHVHLTKFFLRNPLLFEYFESSAASTLGATHLDNRLLSSCLDYDVALLLKETSAYLSNLARPKSEFSCRLFSLRRMGTSKRCVSSSAPTCFPVVRCLLRMGSPFFCVPRSCSHAQWQQLRLTLSEQHEAVRL